VAADGQAAGFLAACGFDQYDEILHFEAALRPFHADMLQLRRRLEQRGSVPPDARVARLRDAKATAVADLVAANFPATRAQMLGRLTRQAPDAYDLDNSVALQVGDALGGVLIYGWDDGLPMIEVRVVAPALRGTWANVLLLEAATRNAVAAGAAGFRFFADRRIADTMSLARRANAEQIKVERHFWRRAD
jgi:hypothetical protein